MLRYVAVLLISLIGANGVEVQVFAAASLTQVLREIGTNYFHRSGDRLHFNFGASSLLARQIEAGAPADIFFSADDEKMEALEGRGLIAHEHRKNLLSNRLVVVVARDGKVAIRSAKDLAQVSRLALAEPKTVPAGIYARKYLETIGLWQTLQKKVVPSENVRGALGAVEAGNADAAIVYETDATISKKVRVAYSVPPEQTPEIHYSVAVLKGTENPNAAKRTLEYLCSPEAAAVYRKYGFIVRADSQP